MNEHTPGSWHTGPPMKPSLEDHGYRRLATMTDKKTCIYAPKGEWQLNWPHEANAVLMAAAPDLLDALTRYVNCDGHEDEIKEQARAAIKKAEKVSNK